jgi:ribosomal protein L37AE/L43A
MKNHRCPACGSPDLRRSRSSGFWDSIREGLGGVAYRCRSCDHRFFGPPPEKPVEDSAAARTIPGIDSRTAEPAPEPAALASFAPPPAAPAEVTIRQSAEEPVAAVLVRASSQDDLSNLLLNLDRALRVSEEAAAERRPSTVESRGVN